MNQGKGNKKGAYNKAHSARIRGRIIAAGIPMGDLARQAGKHASTLSQYLRGDIRSYYGQMAIYDAFCLLARRPRTHLGAMRFWGNLFARKAG